MGSVYIAECKCGFKSEDLCLGVGMRSSNNIQAPAICINCNKLVVLNYADEKPVCPECKGDVIFYNDIKMHAAEDLKKKRPVFFQWSIDDNISFKFVDMHYKCPLCGKMKMKFERVGFWD